MVYFIIGIRRSGLHAIANWLFPMMGEYIYLNNYELGKLSDKELIINGNFNVIIGIENKPYNEILKYCQGTRIWVTRDFKDIEKSQRAWYKNAGLTKEQIQTKIAKAIYLYNDYNHYKHHPGDLCIEYELWNDSEPYRKLITEDLGLEFNDCNKEKIFGYGQSSY